MKKLLFIINPISVKACKQDVVSVIKQTLPCKEFECAFAFTQYPKHAVLLAEEAQKLKLDGLIAVGGDGTVHDVGVTLVGKSLPLGIIPLGSANGLARELNIPRDLKDALKIIAQFKAAPIDTAKINDTFFLGTAGIGYDAHIAWLTKDSKKRGLFNYAKHIFQELPFYQPKKVALTIDQVYYELEAFIVTFANIRQYGGGAFIAPHAQPTDNFLDVIIAKPHPIWAVPKLTYQLFKGTLDRSLYMLMIRCKEVIVHNQQILSGHVDGDPITFEKNIQVKCLPQSLNVIIP